MKKLLIGLIALWFAFLAGGIAFGTDTSMCDNLYDTIGQEHEIYVAENYMDEMWYIEQHRQRLMWNKQAGAWGEIVPFYMFMQHRNLTCIGKTWLENREAEGIYVCENSCDSRAGEVIKTRDRCYRID